MKDLTGRKYGRLTVIKESTPLKRTNRGYRRRWECQCDCGNTVIVVGDQLESGKTHSCGCLRTEMLVARRKTHGRSGTSLHNVWLSMKARCKNSNCWAYDRYGGRGITYCKEWEIFENFLLWAESSGYKEGLTIDRIDNNGNYEPSNCQWVDMKHQCWNRNNSIMIEYHGQKKALAEWCDELNLSYSKTYQRITKLKWDVERAFEWQQKIKS